MSLQTINTPRDQTFNSTENTPRNIADVLADELAGIAAALDPTADDYDQLSNRPQINGVTLTGNKTPKQLGIRQTICLTSAQYAQLSSAEKMDVDKDYIITDANNVNVPIDDTTPSINKVYSSSKVQTELNAIDSNIEGLKTYTKIVDDTLTSTAKSTSVAWTNYHDFILVFRLGGGRAITMPAVPAMGVTQYRVSYGTADYANVDFGTGEISYNAATAYANSTLEIWAQ